MNHLTNWIKSNPLTALIALVIIVVFLVVFSDLIGGQVEKFNRRRYDRATVEAHKEIQGLKDEAAKSKQIAADALKELALEKERGAIERGKREIAEKILADKSKTTNEKIAEYEAALRGAPVVSPPADTNELCRRAAALGINCE